MANEVEIKVNADATKATQTMNKFTEKVKNVGAKLAGVATKLGVVGAAVSAFGFVAANQFASAGDAIDKMRGRTNLSARTLQTLSHAADLSGASIGNVESAVMVLGKKLPNIEKGAGPASDAFKAMGLNLEDFMAMNTEQRFMMIGDSLSKVTDETLQLQHAEALLGGAGVQLMNLFKGGLKDSMADAESQLESFGGYISDEGVSLAAQYTDAMDKLGKSKRALIITIGELITPWLMTLTDHLRIIIGNFVLWTKAHPQVTKAIMGLAGALSLLLPLLLTLKIVIPLVTFGLKGLVMLKTGILALRTAFIALNIAVAPWIAIPALLIAGVALLVVAYKKDFGVVRQVVDFYVNAILKIWEFFINGFIEGFNTMLSILRPFAGFIEEHLGIQIPSAVDKVSFSFDGLKEKAGSMADSVKGSFSDMTKSVTGFFDVTEPRLASGIHTMFEGAKEKALAAKLNIQMMSGQHAPQTAAAIAAIAASTGGSAGAAGAAGGIGTGLVGGAAANRVPKTMDQIMEDMVRAVAKSDVQNILQGGTGGLARDLALEFGVGGSTRSSFGRGAGGANQGKLADSMTVIIENPHGLDVANLATSLADLSDRVEDSEEFAI